VVERDTIDRVPRAGLFDEDAALTIVPIFRRELVCAARRARLQSERSTYAGLLLTIVLGTFGARYYLEHGHVSNHLMAGVAQQSFLLIVAVHSIMVLVGGPSLGALNLAREKDRRTLDFLLATRLSNTEIVLGALAASLAAFFMNFAAGLPIVLLLNLLGGVDPGLIVLAYGAIASMTFFTVALSIWISTGALDYRRAASVTALCIVAWLLVPMLAPLVLTGLRLRLPEPLFTMNSWALASSPLSLLTKFVGGMPSASALLYAVSWMTGLQVGAGIVLVLGAIARLRSAYRVNLGGDGHGLGAARKRPGWRIRPRPAVSDDPILWREMYTARGGIFMQLIGLLILSVPCAMLAYGTFFFARRAFGELWRNGYAAGVTTLERPEFNLMLRFFFTEPIGSAPLDLARVDFNLFLRSATTPIVFLLALMTAGVAADGISSERVRATWDSLIATPLAARDILRSKLLACLWRLRGLLLTLLVLWSIGLMAGAIHPLGFFLTALELAAWTWFLILLGLLASVRAKDPAESAGRALGLLILPVVSGIIPFLLPARLSSVLIGAGSTPFVTWLSLVSYRDVRAALHYSVFPNLAWAGIAAREGVIPVLATCLIGIIVPALGGLWIWRTLLANFDRLIGRPEKGVRSRFRQRKRLLTPFSDEDRGRHCSNPCPYLEDPFHAPCCDRPPIACPRGGAGSRRR